MLRRAAFKSKLPPARPAKQWTGDSLPGPRAQLVRIDDGRARLTVSIPKGVKAKPGKRAPTSVERDWMEKAVRFGCMACWIDGHPPRPTAIHHLLRGGQRIGHLFTIGLCDPGHHQGGDALGLVSRHPWKARFESKYGTELQLLALLQREIAGIR